MAHAQNPALPAPPNLITSLRTGFDAIANHMVVIIIPILMDVLLWLGPHVQVKTLFQRVIDLLTSSEAWTSSQSGMLLENNQQLLQDAALRMNLMSSLRSFPVGVPSLMASRLPIAIPGGEPTFWDVSSLWVILGLGCLLFVIGLAIGSLYYSLVAQAALGAGIDWRKAVQDWPRAVVQVLSLTLALLGVLLILSLPVGCVLSVIAWGGISMGQVGLLFLMGVLVWLGFPLIFTPHGIFAYQDNVLTALRKSIRLTRLTLPGTSLLFLVALVIGEGLNILWRIPAEDSWLTLVGIAGHAFITTGLLTATFVYYREADRWVQQMVEKMSKPPANPNPSV